MSSNQPRDSKLTSESLHSATTRTRRVRMPRSTGVHGINFLPTVDRDTTRRQSRLHARGPPSSAGALLAVGSGWPVLAAVPIDSFVSNCSGSKYPHRSVRPAASRDRSCVSNPRCTRGRRQPLRTRLPSPWSRCSGRRAGPARLLVGEQPIVEVERATGGDAAGMDRRPCTFS